MSPSACFSPPSPHFLVALTVYPVVGEVELLKGGHLGSHRWRYGQVVVRHVENAQVTQVGQLLGQGCDFVVRQVELCAEKQTMPLKRHFLQNIYEIYEL